MMSEKQVKLEIEKIDSYIREYGERIARTNNIDVLKFLNNAKNICEARKDALVMVLNG